jgi:hypothetical protein
VAFPDRAGPDFDRPLPPPVPSELTDAQGAVWRDTVGSLPGYWLTRAAFPILIAYCRHVCRARLLEMEISRFDAEWVAVGAACNVWIGFSPWPSARRLRSSRRRAPFA